VHGLARAPRLFRNNGISRPRSLSPAPGNVASGQNDRPLRQQDASHEGHRICSKPTVLPPPTCCLKSMHEVPPTHNVKPKSYKSISTCAPLSRTGGWTTSQHDCQDLLTSLPRYTTTMFCIHISFLGARRRTCILGEISGQPGFRPDFFYLPDKVNIWRLVWMCT